MILSFHFFTGGKCYFCSQCSLHEKPYFLLANVLKISFFQKKTLEYDLCCIVMKDGICFPENMILFFRRTNERCSFSKNTWKYDIFYIFGIDDTSFSYNMILLLCQ